MENNVFFEVLDKNESKAIKTLSELIMSYKEAIIQYRDMYKEEHNKLISVYKDMEDLQQNMTRLLDWAKLAIIKSDKGESPEWEALKFLYNTIKGENNV